MKIGEAAKKAGISPGNIRFYEKKGLLKPKREESSSYRSYTEEDVERLKRILVFRKTDLSVESIALLLEGEEEAETLLEKQEEVLEGKMKVQEGRKFSPAEEMLGQISYFTAECYGGSGLFLIYNLSFLKYWSNKRKTAE